MSSHSTEWNTRNRDKVNAYKRAYRLKRRKALLEGKHCLNCTALLTECPHPRSKLYCLKCMTEYSVEVRRETYRRYHHRHKQTLNAKKRLYAREYWAEWGPLINAARKRVTI